MRPARLSRDRRLEFDRHRLGLRAGTEERPALGRELRFIADHAGRDAIDIGNFRAAETKRIAGAGLLLVATVGMARVRQDRERARCGDDRAKAARESNDKHESPNPQGWWNCESRGWEGQGPAFVAGSLLDRGPYGGSHVRLLPQVGGRSVTSSTAFGMNRGGAPRAASKKWPCWEITCRRSDQDVSPNLSRRSNARRVRRTGDRCCHLSVCRAFCP